jgi:cytochrome c551/c552
MRKTALAFSLAGLFAVPALAADPASIDWSKVPAKTVTLFYPGQSSYEWLVNDHKGEKGAPAVKRGQSCVRCHEDEEKKLGESLVKGGPLEPMPVKGKNGWVDLSVQAAYDARSAFLRFRWKTQSPFPGIEYPYYRFDGKEWKVYGQPRLDKPVQEGKAPAIYEDRLSVMLDDGKVENFSKQGCWLTCHTGERDMPGVASKEDAQANALLAALKKDDVRKFLPATRTDPTNWKTGKSPDEIAKLKAAGGFLDLIQWRAHRSNPVGMADDGYVLEYRNFDAGKNMFSSNLDAKTRQPKFMWDAKKAGYKSVAADALRKGEHLLLAGQNAVAFDPGAGWKAGDMLPRYVLSRAGAEGSAADNNASGAWQDGVWTVVIVRPLGLANADDKALKAGGVYSVGFAVHDDNITTRGHFVSFPLRLGLGAEADIKAVKLP